MVGAAVAMLACGEASPAKTPPATVPASTPTPTANAPTGPPTAQVMLVGAPSIAGAMHIDTVACSYPSVSGEQIFITGSPAASSATSIHLTLSSGSVAVVADTGSGTSFHARTFSGTGINGFDAATGAQLTGALTETTPSGDNVTGVGKLTSITGTISCAGQTPGSSTMTLTGTLAQGAASGPLTDARVICTTAAGSPDDETFGIVQIGGSPELTIIFSLAGHFTVDLVPTPNMGEFFTSAASATSTPTAAGAMVGGDATEQVAAGATAHTIHVTGQSTCGSGITP
jgi:hypothetical protein